MLAHAMTEGSATLYVDVEAARLEADEGVMRTAREVLMGAWSEYLRRVLPPLPRGYAGQDASMGYSAASA